VEFDLGVYEHAVTGDRHERLLTKIDADVLTLPALRGGLSDDVVAELVTAPLVAAPLGGAALNDLVSGHPRPLADDDVCGAALAERCSTAQPGPVRTVNLRVIRHD